jgi:hypothetical protein
MSGRLSDEGKGLFGAGLGADSSSQGTKWTPEEDAMLVNAVKVC